MGKTSGVQEHSQARRRLDGRLAAACLAAALVALSACSNGSARLGQGGSASGPDPSLTMHVPAGALRVPVMLPFPVDKAGYELSTEFWVPPPARGKHPRTYYVGLRMLFTAGDPDGRISLVDNNPIQVKVDLRHIDGDKEVPVVLRMGAWVKTGPGPFDKRFDVRELLDGVTQSEGDRSGHSDLPRGTPDGMYYQMGLGGAGLLTPGRYRLQARVLQDQPRLQGVPMFLTFRETEHSQ